MTTIFFAGAEIENTTRALLDNGVRHILYSFYYILTQRREGFVRRIQEENPGVSWFLDSGAFTYFSFFKRNSSRLMDWREYRRRYMTYVGGTWRQWDRIAELDLDETFDGLTPEVMADWREEMLDSWPDASVTPVWHASRGLDEWSRYCADPRLRYLAVGSGSDIVGRVIRMIWRARDAGKSVHGLGFTKINTMLNLVHFDSVDSSSWLAAQRYGSIFAFMGGKLVRMDKDRVTGRDFRKKLRRYFESIGVSWAKVEAEDVAECRKANVIAWRMAGDRLRTIRRRQGRSLPVRWDNAGVAK